MKTTGLYKLLLMLVSATLFFYNASGQSATVNLRPKYVDISDFTSQSAILVTLSGYPSSDARFRLYEQIEQYNCWDADSKAYVTSNLYEDSPLAIGNPTGSTTFWISYQRGLHASTVASYRDRLGSSGYSTSYQTVQLPDAAAIAASYAITGKFTGLPGYDLSAKYIILGFSSNTLICAASTELNTGDFSLVCPSEEKVDKIQIRTLNNVTLLSIWVDNTSSTKNTGKIPGNRAAPWCSIIPSQGTTNVSTTISPIISIDQAVQNIDGTEITDANVASLITFKKGSATGTDEPFTATISADKTTITIEPVADRLVTGTKYYLAIDPVQNSSGVSSEKHSSTFTIQGTPPSEKPPVVSFSPTAGESNISTGVIPTISFNEAVYKVGGAEITNADLASLVALKTESSSGTAIPYTGTISADKMTITITPSASLSYNQKYYVSLQPIQNKAGIKTILESATFTTEAVGDTIAPTAAFTPVNAEKGVPIGVLPSIQFNEQVFSVGGATLTSLSAMAVTQLKKGGTSGTAASFTIRVAPDMKSFLIRPNQLLSYNTTYSLELDPVQDAAGNLTKPQSVTFTTEENPDKTPPVATFDPADNSTNVSIGVLPSLAFSEQVFNVGGMPLTNADAHRRITLRQGSTSGAIQEISAFVSPNYTSILVRPSNLLLYNTTYYLMLDSLQDAAGNLLLPQMAAFTTESAPDLQPPSITFYPTSGSRNIAVGTIPTITFDEQVFTIGGGIMTNAAAASILSIKKVVANGIDVPFSVWVSTDKKSFTIKPQNVLDYNTPYYVKIEPIEDAVGNKTISQTATFWTEKFVDTLPPIATITPADKSTNVGIGTLPIVSFDEPVYNIGSGTISDANVASLLTLKKDSSSGTNVPFTASISASKMTITVTPTGGFQYGTTYYFAVNPVQDPAGNQTAAKSVQFTTEAAPDTLPPVPTFTPINKATNVSIGVLPIVDFDEQIFNLSGGAITNSEAARAIKLKQNNASGANVPFTVNTSPDRMSFFIRPTSPLSFSSTYYLSIDSVQDAAGNKISLKSITFTTEAAPDILAPVATITPSDKSIDVPIGVLPIIDFDEQVFSIGGAEMTNAAAETLVSLRVGNATGAAVPYTVTVSPNKMGITVRPTAPLDFSKTYYLSVDPVQDAAGNQTTLTSVTFTTVAAPDTLVPVATFLPKDKEIDVPIGVLPIVDFDEQIFSIGGAEMTNAAAEALLSFRVGSSTGAQVPFTVNVSPNKMSLTIRPITPLNFSTTYFLSVNPVQDAAGNKTALQSITFTTVTAPDTLVPVATFTPINSSIDVPIGVLPIVDFDEQIFSIGGAEMTNAAAETLISLKVGGSTGASVPFTATVSPNKMGFTIRPKTPLGFSTTYYLSVAPVQDAAGNKTALQSITFTTQGEPDTTPPAVLFLPQDKATNVSIGVLPIIDFDEQVFSIGGAEITNAAAEVLVNFRLGSATGTTVPYTVSVSPNKMGIIVRPQKPLNFSSTYYLSISPVQDAAGNKTVLQSITFTTEAVSDTIPPVLSFTPTDKSVNNTIGIIPHIDFDEQVFSIGGAEMTNAAAEKLVDFRIGSSTGAKVPFTVSLSADKMSISVRPLTVLTYSTAYFLSVGSVQDDAGNKTQPQSITFTTEQSDDNLAPIATFSPEDAETNVSVGVMPSIIFDEQVYSLGGAPMTNAAAKSILSLKKGGAAGVDIPFTVTVSPNLLSFLVKPSVLLEFNTTYYLELRPLQDAVGSQTTTQSVSFTTEASDDTTPPIATFVPVDKMTNVPIGVLPAVIFDEQIFSVGGAAITNAGAAAVLSLKKDGSLGQSVPFTVRVSNDLRSFLIRPSTPLQYSATYYLELRPVEDAEGNQTALQSITFTTEENPDKTAPTVSFNPLNGATNVSVGVFPSITFDEQVLSIGGGTITDYVAASLIRFKENNASGASIPFTVRVYPGMNSFLIRPTNILAYSTTYYIEQLPIQDANGNQTTAQSITFTTEQNSDQTPPIASFMPSDKMTNIPIGIMPTITFDEQVFSIGGAAITNALAANVLSLKIGNAAGQSIPFKVMVSPSLNSFLIRPNAPLAYNTTYYLELRPVEDALGNQTIVQGITFTTEPNPDTSAPIATFSPSNAETDISIGVLPVINFDEQVFSIGGAQMTAAGAKAVLKLKQTDANGANVAFSVILTPDMRSFIIKPEVILAYNTKYYIELQPVQDALGNASATQSVTFTTEANPDSTPPQAVFTPANEATNVPVGVIPSITFDEQVFSLGGAPMSNAGAASIITLKQGGLTGAPVPFTAMVSPNMQSILIRPSKLLAYNTAYYLEIKPLQDGVGNQTQTMGVMFTTEQDPDSAAPTATFKPANAETNVAVGVLPTITFDEQVFSIGGGEMTSTSAKAILSLKKDNASGADVPFTVSVTPDMRSFVIRPAGLLLYNTSYYLELRPLQDALGNTTSTKNVSFTTQANPDNAAPVATFNPTNAATNVSIGVMPTIRFDEQVFTVNGAAMTNAAARSIIKLKKDNASGADVAFSVMVSPDMRSFTIRPSVLFSYSTAYYLELGPVKDANGNASAVQSITFTTAANPDSTPPTATFNPANAEANVSIGVMPTIVFDEQVFAIGGASMTNTLAKSALKLKKDSASGTDVAFIVMVSDNAQSFTIRPLVLLSYSTTYYLELGPIQDNNGNATTLQSITFTTQASDDGNPPIATFHPADAETNVSIGAIPTVAFDEQVFSVGGASITNATAKTLLKLKKDNALGLDIPFNVTVAPNMRSFVVRPLNVLAYNTKYYLELAPVQDANGNASAVQSVSFTTQVNPDVTPPTATFYPVNAQANVAVGVLPSISFDEQVFAIGGVQITSALAKTLIKLKKDSATGVDIPFTIAVAPNMQSFLIRPKNILEYNTGYYLELAAVQDALGNATSVQSISFTTEANPDNVPPKAIFDPKNGAANVSVGILPTITFDEQVFAIGGADMTSAAAKMVLRLKKDNASGVDVPFKVAVSPNLRSFLIKPSSALSYNTTYYLELGAVQDANANATAAQSITFTTEAIADNTPPAATFNPANGSTNVAISTTPIITFNEQVFANGGAIMTNAAAKAALTLKNDNGDDVPFAVAVSPDMQSFSIYPSTLLSYGTVYYLELGVVQDASGNQAPAQSIAFTTRLLNNEADIVAGSVENQVGNTIINNAAKSVMLATANSANLNAIDVLLTISRNATITPNPSTVKNYSAPVQYTVTSEDGSVTNIWTVTVYKAPVAHDCPYHLTFIPGTHILQLCNYEKGVSGVEIYTTDGRLIYTNHNMTDEIARVDMSNYSGGLYVIRIFDGEGLILETVKVVK